jgi:hypothetical protein
MAGLVQDRLGLGVAQQIVGNRFDSALEVEIRQSNPPRERHPQPAHDDRSMRCPLKNS